MQPQFAGRLSGLLASTRVTAGRAATRSCFSSSGSLGADPGCVSQARATFQRALSGAFSRETLLPRSGGRGFSLHEMQLAGSCCVYGRQKWDRSLTVVCTGGHCGVELLDVEFQPPGSGRLVSLGVGNSVSLPPGRGYYLRGSADGAVKLPARILVISVPPLEGSESQDCDGSFPAPPPDRV